MLKCTVIQHLEVNAMRFNNEYIDESNYCVYKLLFKTFSTITKLYLQTGS